MATLFHATLLVSQTDIDNLAQFGVDFETNIAVGDEFAGDVLTAMRDGWNSFLKLSFSPQTVLRRLTVFPFDIGPNPTPPPAFRRVITSGPFSSEEASAGTAVGDPSAPQVAQVVTHRSVLSSRRTRGRVYLFAPPEPEVFGNGALQEVYRVQTQGRYNNWIIGIQNAAVFPQTYTHVVISLTGNLVSPVTERLMNGRVDTQRRRLPR